MSESPTAMKENCPGDMGGACATLVWLEDALDPAGVGWKAARLGQLRKDGRDVSAGVVMPVATYRRWMEETKGIGALSPEILGPVIVAAEQLGYPLVVQPSPVEEETDCSLSAQTVTGPQELAEAVLRCWKSVSTQTSSGLGVIVQKKVGGLADGKTSGLGDFLDVPYEGVDGPGDGP